MSKRKKKKINDNVVFYVCAAVILIVLFAGVFFAAFILGSDDNVKSDEIETEGASVQGITEKSDEDDVILPEETTVNSSETTTLNTQDKSEMTTAYAAETTASSAVVNSSIISYPSDTASWKLICLNRNRCVDSSAENKISLSYVAGSSERMDPRAAEAYEEMYTAAKADGYYLTPCSGYRSYSTQKRLYYEFVNEYINDGYSESEAHNLASKRRNPPGSSEHNIGICMDIICASSSADFQNTQEYAWLCENAHKYGFILRYPENKSDITGVKFEPWHWRYVGVENAESIKNSGLCLEEYLGLA